MPIKGLTDRGLKFPVIGKIRKGAKAPSNSGKERPIDLTYFRVEIDEMEPEAAAKFKAVYGDKPTDLNVVLPFNDIEKCWDAYREAYLSNRMVAKSDGEKILYLVDPGTGEVLARDGFYTDGRPAIFDESSPFVPGVKDYKGRPVKWGLTGRMNVVIPELQRAAYMEVITHSWNDIGNISDQLRALASINGGQIAGVPLILRRRPAMVGVPMPDGKRVYREKWLLSIEADPKWVGAKLSEMNRLALPTGDPVELELPALPAGEPDDDEDIIHAYAEKVYDFGGMTGPDDTDNVDPRAEIDPRNTSWAGVEHAPEDIGTEEPDDYEAEQLTMDVGTQPPAEPYEKPKMTLEQAKKVKTSKGLEYGEASTAALVAMSKAINTKLMALKAIGKNLSEDDIKEVDRLAYKLDAIKVVLTDKKE